MTYQEFKNKIKSLADSLSVPFAYYQFEGEKKDLPEPPFLIFNYPESDDFYADNINYQGKTEVELFYCSDEKDFAAEQTIEDFFRSNEMTYTKEQTYIDTSEMWETKYNTEVFINEQS